jgi:hypothetical protein
MQQRRISNIGIDVAIAYGRVYFARGTEIYVIGQREIRKHADDPNVTPDLNGLHVICHTKSGLVLTCYRNPRLKRPRTRSPRRPRRRLNLY